MKWKNGRRVYYTLVLKEELTIVLFGGIKNALNKDIKEAITDALFETDYDTFKECVAILLDKCDYGDITKITGLSKTTLYRMCELSSNPTLENIGKVLSYINDLELKKF